jgi:hypothetical protein
MFDLVPAVPPIGASREQRFRANLQKDQQLKRGSAPARATKLESAVRYLEIEADDAVSISEQVDL